MARGYVRSSIETSFKLDMTEAPRRIFLVRLPEAKGITWLKSTSPPIVSPKRQNLLPWLSIFRISWDTPFLKTRVALLRVPRTIVVCLALQQQHPSAPLIHVWPHHALLTAHFSSLQVGFAFNFSPSLIFMSIGASTVHRKRVAMVTPCASALRFRFADFLGGRAPTAKAAASCLPVPEAPAATTGTFSTDTACHRHSVTYACVHVSPSGPFLCLTSLGE